MSAELYPTLSAVQGPQHILVTQKPTQKCVKFLLKVLIESVRGRLSLFESDKVVSKATFATMSIKNWPSGSF